MKSFLHLSLVLVLALGANSAFAKIWRLNNNPGGFDADFATLQDAHLGASAGDTLYLEGSPNSYGGLTCTKKLVIMGPGYYLGENNIASINTATALVSTITMNPGSQGSEIMGLDFNGSTLYLQTSDIIVKRNKFANYGNGGTDVDRNNTWSVGLIHFNSQSANNIFIIQNFGVRIYGASFANTGVLITNNLIAAGGSAGNTTTNHCLEFHEFTMGLVQNNIFLRGTVSSYRSTFTNNIMVNGFFEKRENMASNNVGSGTQFGTTDGNKSSVDMSTVFLGTGSPDERFQLKVGSPAIGAGYGSTVSNPVDAGMFWGNTAYKLSGLPGIPVIYFINVQAVGSNTDPIDVTVKVKSTK